MLWIVRVIFALAWLANGFQLWRGLSRRSITYAHFFGRVLVASKADSPVRYWLTIGLCALVLAGLPMVLASDPELRSILGF